MAPSCRKIWRKYTMENEKIYGMDFNKIYQLLLNKALRKGRTKEETDEVIR